MAEKRRVYVCATREGSLEEEVVGNQFPDDHSRHAPCCQSPSTTQELRLGRVMFHVVHYPEVSHVVKTVSQAFFRCRVQRQPWCRSFPHNPGEIDFRNSTFPTSVPA